ncbi:MAG: hypothetical protein Q8R45_03180 [Brevundimonas sp.]|uniref:hypothetical protein n=1 Tax=Brevundimonas sp. TaxID=1871086 RepID=UPI00271C532C|nr:hypothetical protein [Brevundimonas sp.]MDO9587216.1 hypothetical protein [Brevundimonas sp.]MDP3371266.1 hypothetical protein [Brevundimonas sp.]MDP3655953.1 hypothetical protein [Brevundimonas sp.]MDZ4113278.1 hypothetical protein [Brevundimonas sp.]
MTEVRNGTTQADDARDTSAYSNFRAPLEERRSYAAPYESLTFTLVTRGGRELTVTLAAQPVFDLTRSIPVSRRIRRTVRHCGGEGALAALGRRTLEPVDLKRIDLQTLSHGLDLLHLGPDDSGVLPAFWRTVATSGGRFALLCAELQHDAVPGTLLVEVMGGLEQAPPDAIDEAITHFETATLGVILHIAPDPSAARRLAGVRARCLAIDFAGVAHESSREWLEASELIAAARDACAQVMLLNLRPDRGRAAQAAGATHAVFAGMEAITV